MRARDKAAFCLLTGVAPSEYPALTVLEKDAFIELATRRKR